MRKRKLYEKIIEENYMAIFRFCNARLRNDHYGAEECTQEVFLLFLQKKDDLDLNDHIDRWLIAAASRITKAYLRKKAEQVAFEAEEFDELSDKNLVSNFYEERSSVFEDLTDEEYDLLIQYYAIEDKMRNEIAAELGISVNTLYQRIHTIKSKIKQPKKRKE